MLCPDLSSFYLRGGFNQSASLDFEVSVNKSLPEDEWTEAINASQVYSSMLHLYFTPQSYEKNGDEQ